jgi:glycosyltransferase involved in cell wall biosynthesis
VPLTAIAFSPTKLMKSTICVAEDRKSCERSLKLLLLCLNAQCHQAAVSLFYPPANDLILPYTRVFQSGVLFLGYSFGLPAIAADVGTLEDEIIEGQTGFVFRAQDSSHLASKRSTLRANYSAIWKLIGFKSKSMQMSDTYGVRWPR